MRLHFVRHGESEANVLRQFSNRGRRHGLTERGRQQSAALAERLRGLRVAALYTSPLLRATETSDILAVAFGVVPLEADGLREFDCGVLEGRSDEASWERYRQIVRAWVERGEYDTCLDDGESFNVMRRRFLPLVERVVRDHGRQADDVILVGHGGLFCLMLPLVLSNVDYTFVGAHPPANTCVITAEPDAPGALRCLQWCGVTPAGS